MIWMVGSSPPVFVVAELASSCTFLGFFDAIDGGPPLPVAAASLFLFAIDWIVVDLFLSLSLSWFLTY